jgi:lipopolysaccharide transport system ATP-binding protein
LPVVIKIENISKQYRLGLTGTGTLSHDLNRWWHLVRGKEDPYLKIGDINDRSIKGESDYVWALKDINIDVQQGEVLGIIGKNGAGKSTLLKILSKVTSPTTGSITYQGRIGSLLEVGTGFHPELTGKENIFLNGTILGMRRKEIENKYDEIVSFSGCERYIDTPVKRYSSGMMVRLGFAVAAFLEPEILVVDEVLAVGDAEFQKKAIGKMQEVSKNDGRTVLFVSHNMTAIQSLCSQAVLLENGGLKSSGKTKEIISKYLEENNIKKLEQVWDELSMPGNEFISVKSVKIITQNGTSYIDVTTSLQIVVDFVSHINDQQINLSMVLKDIKGEPIFNDSTPSRKLNKGVHRAIIHIPGNFLNDGIYTIDNYFVKDSSSAVFTQNEPVVFEVNDTIRPNSGWYGKWIGAVRPKFNWEYYEIERID